MIIQDILTQHCTGRSLGSNVNSIDYLSIKSGFHEALRPLWFQILKHHKRSLDKYIRELIQMYHTLLGHFKTKIQKSQKPLLICWSFDKDLINN